jgi:hypothetical protein
MRFKKTIEVSVDIEDTVSFYADPNNMINTLRASYNGRCYALCKIINVESIEAQGPCIYASLGQRYAGSVSVRFVASVITYNRDDILHGCKVIQIDSSGTIRCATKHATLLVKGNKSPLLAAVKPGHLISLRVGQSTYAQFNELIAINAAPLVARKPVYYEITGEPCGETPAIIAAQAVIRKEMQKTDALRKANNKGWTQFNKLFYAYKEPQQVQGEIPLEVILSKECPRWVARDPRMDLSSAKVVGVDSPPVDATRNEALTREQVAVTCFLDYAQWLRTVRKTCEVYNTAELITAHTDIWVAMKGMKL